MNIAKLRQVLEEFEGNDLLENLDQFGGEVEVIRELLARFDKAEVSRALWRRAAEEMEHQIEMEENTEALLVAARFSDD